jgi:hypothetical protein
MDARVRRTVAAAAVAAGVLGSALAAPAGAENIGRQGCTPGYWKNHTSAWEEYSPSTTLGVGNTAMFRFAGGPNAMDDAPAAVQQYASTTALQALSFRGGNGVDGAARILLRAAVAAYLNAAHEGVGYPLRRRETSELTGEAPLIVMIDDALDSGNRAEMLALADKLDRYNNLGCPL